MLPLSFPSGFDLSISAFPGFSIKFEFGVGSIPADLPCLRGTLSVRHAGRKDPARSVVCTPALRGKQRQALCTYWLTLWYSLAIPWWVQSFPRVGKMWPRVSDLNKDRN